MTRNRTRILLAAAAALVLVLLAPEIIYFFGTCAIPPLASKQGSCGILVLGSPTLMDGTPSPMQISRVATAVDLMERAGCSLMVLSGGNPHSPVHEADSMARLARAAGVPESKLVLERKASNTWENLAYSLEYLTKFDTIYLVSDGLHVHRGKRILCRQWPAQCARARVWARYRFGEAYRLKWDGTLHEPWDFVWNISTK